MIIYIIVFVQQIKPITQNPELYNQEIQKPEEKHIPETEISQNQKLERVKLIYPY